MGPVGRPAPLTVHQREFALPRPDDRSEFARVNAACVIACVGADGTKTGFAPMKDERGNPLVADVPGATTLGEQSEITRFGGAAEDNTAATVRAFDLTFQVGNLVAGVIVSNVGGEEPAVAEIEALAAKLGARIEAVRARGDGLGTGVLRLTGPDVGTSYDLYGRRDGETISFYGEPPEVLAAREAGYGTATDVYLLDQSTARAGNPTYALRLYRYATPEEASATLRDAPQQLAVQPPFYVDIQPVADAVIFGDESLTISYGLEVGDQITPDGYLILARFGGDVIRVQLDAIPEDPRTAVEALMAAQVACRSAGACTAPVPAEIAAGG